MHYLVFVPNGQPSDLDALSKVSGLSTVLGSHSVVPQCNGPNHTTGLMIGWTSPTSPLTHFDEAKQHWLPSVSKDETGTPRYWVGIWKDKPPTESELRRHYTQDGELITFAGERWKLPTPSRVDARAVYSDDGSMRWEVVRQFSWVCDEAAKLKQLYLDEFGLREMVFSVDPTAQIEWLLKLLQINYRILPEVAVHLDLWVGRKRLLDIFLATLGLSRKGGDDA